jgi:hypothetical protein
MSMRSRIARTVVAAAVLAGAGLGWVVAQDAAVPPVQSPPGVVGRSAL